VSTLTVPTTRTTPLLLLITVGWLAVTLIAGAAGAFSAEGPPAALGTAIVVPPLIVAGLLAWSPWFQAWARSLDLRLLVNLQMWRIGGFAILAAWGVGALPGTFALPAGYGDVLVAVTAPMVAWYIGRSSSRSVFLAWSALGMADLVLAVTLGLLHTPEFGPLAGSVTTAAMGELPLSFIPSFGVPLMFSVHLLALYNARSFDWTAARHA